MGGHGFRCRMSCHSDSDCPSDIQFLQSKPREKACSVSRVSSAETELNEPGRLSKRFETSEITGCDIISAALFPHFENDWERCRHALKHGGIFTDPQSLEHVKISVELLTREIIEYTLPGKNLSPIRFSNQRIKMSKIIAICNQKGGVGPTTTAGNPLARRNGKQTLLIDMDLRETPPRVSLQRGSGRRYFTKHWILPKIRKRLHWKPFKNYKAHELEIYGMSLLPVPIWLHWK